MLYSTTDEYYGKADPLCPIRTVKWTGIPANYTQTPTGAYGVQWCSEDVQKKVYEALPLSSYFGEYSEGED